MKKISLSLVLVFMLVCGLGGKTISSEKVIIKQGHKILMTMTYKDFMVWQQIMEAESNHRIALYYNPTKDKTHIFIMWLDNNNHPIRVLAFKNIVSPADEDENTIKVPVNF